LPARQAAVADNLPVNCAIYGSQEKQQLNLRRILMKAMRIHNYGPANDLTLEEVALPHYTGSDVLIRVAASGVNPIDWKIRSGAMVQAMHFPMPLTPGWECAGTIDAIGHLVTEFKIGDRVFTMSEFSRGGTYAEYVAVDVTQVALMPSTVSFSIAATLPMTALAAWSAIDAAGLQSGQHVLIHGGAGGVGSIAIQLAKLRGARVTTTVSASDTGLARALGADEVLDYKNMNLTDHGLRFDAVVDTVGGPTQEASWGTLKPGGMLVTLTQPAPQGRAEAAGVRTVQVMTQPSGAVLKEIAMLVDAGQLLPSACHSFPLSDAARVHESGETAGLKGRTALQTGPI
jgi:NADPH:quinone reductase-like Zn-dependent oxidoreductase